MIRNNSSNQPWVSASESSRFPLNEISFPGRVDWNLLAESLIPLAYSEPKHLDSQYATIRFTKNFRSCEHGISNVYVVANSENGKPIVRYRLLPELSGDMLKTFRDILDAGLSGELTTLQVLEQLERATPPGKTYAWIPERIKSGQAKEGESVPNDNEVAPMQLVIPSFGEFVKNPKSLGKRFFSAHKVGSCQYRLETLLDMNSGSVIAELFSTDHARGGQPRWDLHAKAAATPKELQTEASLGKDLLLLSYTLHELFWDKGAEALLDFLQEPESPSISSLEPSLDDLEDESSLHENPFAVLEQVTLEPYNCDVVHHLPSGALLKFATCSNEGVVQLLSSCSEEAASCYWIFRNAQDLSLEENPMRQEILRAIEQLSTYESDVTRLNALTALNRMKRAFLSEPATVEHVVGAELARCIANMRNISVTPSSPSTEQDLLDVCNGINHLQIRLISERLKQAPQLFDVMHIGVSNSGDIHLTAFNHLQGRCDAFISSAIFPMFGGASETIRNLSEAFTGQLQTGRVALQNCLQGMCDLDTDSNWVVWSGEPSGACLPPVNDRWGQQTYDLGAEIVKRFSKVSFSSPDESRVSWIQAGIVETTLGRDTDPFLLNFTLKRHEVRRITILDQGRREVASYACHLPIGTSRSAMRNLETAVRLFDDLLTSKAMGGSASFNSSPLFHFLETSFGGTSRSENH